MANLDAPYAYIAAKAIQQCEGKYFGTLIVRIRLDGRYTNEILELDGNAMLWTWQNDWYEGQKDVEFIGAILLDDVKVEED